MQRGWLDYTCFPGSFKIPKCKDVNRCKTRILNYFQMFLPINQFSATAAASENCQKLLRAADGFSWVGNRRNIDTASVHSEAFWVEDGWRALIRWHRFSFEGALQIHVDAQHSRQQLSLVLVETCEDIQDWRATLVHPGGKQAGGADLGWEGLVVV